MEARLRRLEEGKGMMEPFVRRFIRSSLVWLGVGVSLGLWMVVEPSAAVYRAAHMHANLLGFVSMMIFGVAYHVLPRFTGAPLRSRSAAAVHVVIANVGLACLVGGWMARVHWAAPGGVVLVGGAVLSAAGAFLFIGNLWLTMDSAARQEARRPAILRGG